MKVAHLCMTHYGGAGTSAYRLHEGLRSIGMNSSMFVMLKRGEEEGLHLLPSLSGKVACSPGDPQLRISPAWNEAVEHWNDRLRAYPGRPEGLEYFSSFDAQTSLSEIEQIREADVVNLHWVAGMIDFGRELDFLKNKRIVWTLHDMNAFTGGCHYSLGCEEYSEACGACPQLGSSRRGDLSARQWRRRREIYDQLDMTIVTPSRWLAEAAGRSSLLNGFSRHVIPYGLSTNVFRPYPKQLLRKELRIPGDRPVILFGATKVSNQRKGFGFLLQALKQLETHHLCKKLTLAVCGNGMEAYRGQISFPVLELGYIHNEEQMAMAYSLADAFVIPSLQDNLPNVVLESLACGTPVVGFRTGGIPDMLEHGVTGYLSDPESVSDLARGIGWAISTAARGDHARRACRKVALERYPLHGQAEAYRRLYQSVIRQKAAA